MESIFDEIDKDRIAPQRFTLDIILCVVYILLSYDYLVADSATEHYVYLANAIIRTFIAVGMMTYWQNFKATRAVYWMKCQIAVVAAAFIINTISYEYVNELYQQNLLHEHYLRNLLFSYSMDAALLLDLLFSVLIGIEIQKIENDYTRLGKLLGIMLTWFISFPFFGLIIVDFYKPLAAWYFSKDHLWLRLSVQTYFAVPSVVIMLIFYRAKKHFDLQARLRANA